MMETQPSYENRRGVERMRRIDGFMARMRRSIGRGPKAGAWPVAQGRYRVLDPEGCVAVCTLTSKALMREIRAPGVAIVGSLAVPNLGIEKIVRNVVTNPRIRFLVLCGKESQLFQPAQAVVSLFANGVDDARRIIGAEGHLPELTGLSLQEIEHFRAQVSMIDLRGLENAGLIAATIADCVAKNPGPLDSALPSPGTTTEPRLLKRGERRRPIEMDRMGFFIVSVEREAGEIELIHYDSQKQPAHVVRGRSAESLWLPVLNEGLITQLSHAAYLGAELSKAETALRLNLPYDQDQPLRKPEG